VAFPEDLAGASRQVVQTLRERRRQVHDRIRDHELPARLPKARWEQIGKLIKAREEYSSQLPDNRWVSLRLDGCGWGTLLGRLRDARVLATGFNDHVAEAMMASCRAVMSEFGGVLGYTHSDEISVLIPPSQHARSGPRALLDGSVHEWVSIAASLASGEFNRRLMVIAAEQGMELDEAIVAHFDCRAGVFDSVDEAVAMVLWRAYDCHVNSASDAIKYSDAPLRVRRFNTIEKLGYLQSRGMLPLRRHQAYGSLLVERHLGGRRVFVIANDGVGDLPKHVLNLVRLGPLLPTPDVEAETGEDPNDDSPVELGGSGVDIQGHSMDLLSVLSSLEEKALPSNLVWPALEPRCACSGGADGDADSAES